jgi:CrcB protein
VGSVSKITLIALCGAAGAVARYGLTGLVFRIYGGTFPAGTYVVNVVGCLLFGLIWPLAEERLLISGEFRFILLVGFVGSFTTFSSLVFESHELLRESEWLLAICNLGGQIVSGLAALYIGLIVGRSL